jgi:hypothetical protein
MIVKGSTYAYHHYGQVYAMCSHPFLLLGASESYKYHFRPGIKYRLTKFIIFLLIHRPKWWGEYPRQYELGK